MKKRDRTILLIIGAIIIILAVIYLNNTPKYKNCENGHQKIDLTTGLPTNITTTNTTCQYTLPTGQTCPGTLKDQNICQYPPQGFLKSKTIWVGLIILAFAATIIITAWIVIKYYKTPTIGEKKIVPPKKIIEDLRIKLAEKYDLYLYNGKVPPSIITEGNKEVWEHQSGEKYLKIQFMINNEHNPRVPMYVTINAPLTQGENVIEDENYNIIETPYPMYQPQKGLPVSQPKSESERARLDLMKLNPEMATRQIAQTAVDTAPPETVGQEEEES